MTNKETQNMVNKNFLTQDSSLDDNNLWAASATDMTGLAPTVAHNEYEAESYEEVYPYLPPVPPNPVVTVPDTPIAEGIHAEYRTRVTKQHPDKDMN